MESSTLPIHNPAERLLIILQRCSQDKTNESVQTVLSRAMEVKNDSDSFYQGFGKLLELISHIEDQLQYFTPGKQSSYKRLMEKIKYELISLLSRVHDNWLGFGEPLNSPDWEALYWLPSCVEDFEEICLSKEDLNRLGTCVGIISQLIGGRKLCAPTVTDFVHNVGANCVRPKGTLSKRKSLKGRNLRFNSND
jgi:hypothetical protein